jgi:hypothetical protein
MSLAPGPLCEGGVARDLEEAPELEDVSLIA